MNEHEETNPWSQIQKNMERAIARTSSPLDQIIMQFKEIFDLMGDEERTILKSWIAQLVPLQRNPPASSSLMGKASVSFRYRIGPDEDIVVESLPPITISKAIEI